MSCDVTRVFHALIRALESTEDVDSRTSKNNSIKSSEKADSLRFWNRAESLRQNLHTLADYLRRVRQLTGTSVGNKFKQKSHSELTEQVTLLIDQCAELLVQLRGVATKDGRSGVIPQQNRSQLMQHEQVICESLEESLNKLRRLRDAENERQRRLLELTGSLAAGVRSVPPSLLKPPDVPLKNGTLEPRLKQSSSSISSTEKPNETIIRERNNTRDPHLSPVELQSFERENQTLYQHLSEQRDELSLVARAVSEIGRLNQTLSTHLMEQLETAESIGSHFSTASEHIRQGNEFLQSALSSKATVQFWILFIMIVLTFSLHFLDWYYP